MARNVVATSQPLATQAGVDALRRGGNAIDAALSAAITLTVVEPTGNGLGSDAFAVVWDGSRVKGLNASGRSPRRLDPARYRGVMPNRGWQTVTVPGAVSGWVALSDAYGSLPFAELFDAAVTYAEEGFMVSPAIAQRWSSEAVDLGRFEEFARCFMPGGRAPQPGERFRVPDLAHSLRQVAESRGEAFYRGPLAEAMVADAQKHGSSLSSEDLDEHSVEWVDTITFGFRDVTVHEIPPNGQGLATLLMLGTFSRHSAADAPIDSADSLHLQIECMKLALADTYRYVTDPDSMTVTPAQLLEDSYLEERAKMVDMKRAQDPGHGTPPPGGTVYLATADAEGRMVSYIQSNYQGFGSGVVVPGTGISLQNRGAGFTLDPDHPNYISGAKRPFHTIIPGLTTIGGGADMAFGVMGGPIQAQGHAQVVIRTYIHGQNPQVTADALRWRLVRGLEIAIEPGLPAQTLDELAKRGHKLVARAPEDTFAFGGAQIVRRLGDGYIAGSDRRKDGQAAGF